MLDIFDNIVMIFSRTLLIEETNPIGRYLDACVLEPFTGIGWTYFPPTIREHSSVIRELKKFGKNWSSGAHFLRSRAGITSGPDFSFVLSVRRVTNMLVVSSKLNEIFRYLRYIPKSIHDVYSLLFEIWNKKNHLLLNLKTLTKISRNQRCYFLTILDFFTLQTIIILYNHKHDKTC